MGKLNVLGSLIYKNMTAGDMTASTPTLCVGIAAIKTQIDTLTLTTPETDKIYIIPVPNLENNFIVFKVEVEAAI